MIKWIKSLFEKKSQKPAYNLHHPDFVGKFEVAFQCGGVKYYRAVKDYFLPVGRYKFIETRLAEADLRMTSKMLKDYIKELEKHLDGKSGVINLVRVTELVINMKTHCNMEFEPETIKRLAAIVFVDDTEDLRDFDDEHGEKKIKFWESNDSYAFFLTRPIAELLNVNDSSEEYLRKYMLTATEIKASLISGLYNPS
jgi:hypothetical protein